MTVNTIAAPLARPGRAPRAALSAWGPPLAVLVMLLSLWQVGAFHALFRLREFQLPFPLQIALAIVAEIRACFANRAGGPLRDRSGSIHSRAKDDMLETPLAS